MDSRPRVGQVVRAGGPAVDVFSTRNRLLAVSRVTVGDDEVTIASPQYILLNFLFEAFRAGPGTLCDLYIRYYSATLDLIEAGDLLIAALRSEGDGPGVAASTFRSSRAPLRSAGPDNRRHESRRVLSDPAGPVGPESRGHAPGSTRPTSPTSQTFRPATSPAGGTPRGSTPPLTTRPAPPFSGRGSHSSRGRRRRELCFF